MGSAPIRTQGPVQDPWHKQRKGLFSMKLLSCIKQRFQRLSMRRKLFLSYIIPVFFCSILVWTFSSITLQRRSEENLRDTLTQYNTQADNLLTSYLQSMLYITRQLLNNSDLARICSDPDFAKPGDDLSSIREYLNVNPIFQLIELQNGNYRIGMYVPDSVLYSINNYYFYPLSEITERDDYASMNEALSSGSSVYCILRDKSTSDPKSTQDYLAQITLYTVTDRDGNPRSFPVKAEISTATLQKALANAILTPKSLVYLTDPNGSLIASSDPDSLSALISDGFHVNNSLDDWSTIRYCGTDYIVCHHRLSTNNWQIVSLIHRGEYDRQVYSLSRLLFFFFSIILVIAAITSYNLSRYYTNRISVLNAAINEVKDGNLNVQVSRSDLSLPSGDEMDTLYQNFDYMIQRICDLMKEEYWLGKSISHAEMRALQAQINPHFLYNTLDLINWGAMDYGADKVARLSRDLGQFYRLSLNHGKSSILIADELRHVQSYVDIENAHYEDAIDLHIDVPDEIRQYGCLNITLQPFVENSIVHGMAEHPEITSCDITIRAVLKDGDIIFTVTDDGPGIDPELVAKITGDSMPRSSKGFGVSNICFRIRLCYGSEYGVRYITEGHEDGGCEAEIRIKALSLPALQKELGEQ